MKRFKHALTVAGLFAAVFLFISVLEPAPRLLAAKSDITLSESKITIDEGEKLTIRAVTKGKGKLKWKSADKNIAVVSKNGVVRGISAGKTIVTVRFGKKTVKCRVIVHRKYYSDQIKFIAHRGWHEEYLENSIEAFGAAIEEGFWGVETDVRTTSDGVFVLSHNASLWKDGLFEKPADLIDPAEIEGDIGHLTYEQVERLSGGRIATLEDYLALVKDHDIVPVIEVKYLVYPDNLDIPERVSAFLQMIEEHGLMDRVLIISFSKGYLEEIRRQNADVSLQLLSKENAVDIPYLKEHGFSLGWAVKCLDFNVLPYFQQEGIEVSVWVCNSRKETDKALSYHAAHITTDVRLFVVRE
ncbi:MAG: Ig-like domain-containing protein [Eubacterium sp.]|nr:Ig-like domain-containing protein [Eubacterium sp.]